MTVTSPCEDRTVPSNTSRSQRKIRTDVDHVNFYLADGEKITQADLTNFHAAVAQHGLPRAADLLEVKK